MPDAADTILSQATRLIEDAKANLATFTWSKVDHETKHAPDRMMEAYIGLSLGHGSVTLVADRNPEIGQPDHYDGTLVHGSTVVHLGGEAKPFVEAARNALHAQKVASLLAALSGPDVTWVHRGRPDHSLPELSDVLPGTIAQHVSSNPAQMRVLDSHEARIPGGWQLHVSALQYMHGVVYLATASSGAGSVYEKIDSLVVFDPESARKIVQLAREHAHART